MEYRRSSFVDELNSVREGIGQQPGSASAPASSAAPEQPVKPKADPVKVEAARTRLQQILADPKQSPEAKRNAQAWFYEHFGKDEDQ
jgi:hypothetical protein